MKVLLVNGSPRSKSNTLLGLCEMEKIFNAQGIDTEIINIGKKDIHGCIRRRRCLLCGMLGDGVYAAFAVETALIPGYTAVMPLSF